MEARYVAARLGRKHGWITDLSRRSGVGRSVLHNWFAKDAEPRLDALAAVANVLQVPRAELIAAFDDTPRDQPIPDILSDGERRLRRKWWLGVARVTAGLGLGAAREQLAARGFTSSRGNLVALFEDPNSRLEPTPGQLRALAEIYRLSIDVMVELWNNPPITDEEELARRRGGRIEVVREPEVELPEEPSREARRRSA